MGEVNVCKKNQKVVSINQFVNMCTFIIKVFIISSSRNVVEQKMHLWEEFRYLQC